MNISELFKVLKTIETQMDMPGTLQDAELLNDLDLQYEQAWRDVLNFTSPNPDIAELALLLLLDKMTECAARGEKTTQIREKVLELFQTSQAQTSGKAMLRSIMDTRQGVV